MKRDHQIGTTIVLAVIIGVVLFVLGKLNHTAMIALAVMVGLGFLIPPLALIGLAVIVFYILFKNYGVLATRLNKVFKKNGKAAKS